MGVQLKITAMKKLIISLLALSLSLISTGQDVSYEIGRRLSYWATSNGQREALSYQLMRQEYPNESTAQLARRIDNMAYDPATMQSFIVAIYNWLGADYAYTSLRDAFTTAQMNLIDHYYETTGGKIERRNDADRKKNSDAAKLNGINENIALRLAQYCDINQGLRALVFRALGDKGVSTFGCSRIIDNFPSNLDYAYYSIMSIYEREGSTDRAYYTLRNFLSPSEIDMFDQKYLDICREKEEKRQIAISEYSKKIYAKEPYRIPYSNISDFEYEICNKLNRLTDELNEQEYSIVIRDSIFIARDGGNTQRIHLDLSSNIEHLRKPIEDILNGTRIYGASFENKELNYSCFGRSEGYFKMDYSSIVREDFFAVKYNSLQHVECLEGDAKEIEPLIKDIANFLWKNDKTFGKRKVKVVRTIRNGETLDTQISLLKNSYKIESNSQKGKGKKIEDKEPTFEQGDFRTWVKEHMVYPEAAIQNGVTGSVIVQFTINFDGSVTDVKVVEGADPLLDKEAVRVVSSSPKWEPGIADGKAVPVTYSMPVYFNL